MLIPNIPFTDKDLNFPQGMMHSIHRPHSQFWKPKSGKTCSLFADFYGILLLTANFLELKHDSLFETFGNQKELQWTKINKINNCFFSTTTRIKHDNFIVFLDFEIILCIYKQLQPQSKQLLILWKHFSSIVQAAHKQEQH